MAKREREGLEARCVESFLVAYALCVLAISNRCQKCCAQQTGMHILVVEALLIAIYSTWGTSKYLYT
jgi:hypothetical protein